MDLLFLPLKALWKLIKLMVIPAGLVALAWLIFGLQSTVFVVVAIVCAVWAICVCNLWSAWLQGQTRSLGRGSVQIRGRRSGGLKW